MIRHLNRLAPPLLLLATALSAQQTLVVPHGMDFVEGGTSNNYPFGRVTAGAQFLIDGDQISTQQSVINEIRFRQDNVAANGTVPSYTKDYVVTCYTVQTPASVMSATPSVNIGTATPHVVFSGALTLPAVQVLTTWPAAFDIVIPLNPPFVFDPTQGNFLFVIETLNTGAVSGTYRLDAVTIRNDTATGQSASMETNGCIVAGQYLNLSVNAAQAIVGGSITQTITSSSFGAFPAVMTGLSFTVQPQNLAAFGMPTCTSWMGPFVLQFVLENSGGGYPSVVWNLPADPYLEGVALSSQALGVAPTGLLSDSVTSNGVGTRIGRNLTPLVPHSNMSFRTTGSWAMSAVGTSMPIVQLGGVFP